MTKEEHLLVCLAEECAEVAQAVSKALRFGVNNFHPRYNITNAKSIVNELCDITAVVELLDELGIIKVYSDDELDGRVVNKKKRVLRYMETEGQICHPEK